MIFLKKRQNSSFELYNFFFTNSASPKACQITSYTPNEYCYQSTTSTKYKKKNTSDVVRAARRPGGKRTRAHGDASQEEAFFFFVAIFCGEPHRRASETMKFLTCNAFARCDTNALQTTQGYVQIIQHELLHIDGSCFPKFVTVFTKTQKKFVVVGVHAKVQGLVNRWSAKLVLGLNHLQSWLHF